MLFLPQKTKWIWILDYFSFLPTETKISVKTGNEFFLWKIFIILKIICWLTILTSFALSSLKHSILMATQPVYQSQDAKSSSYVSKGDSICFTQEVRSPEWFPSWSCRTSSTAPLLSVSAPMSLVFSWNARIVILMWKTTLWASRRSTVCEISAERPLLRIEYSGSIPVEVNDLVVVNHDVFFVFKIHS